MRFSCNGLGAFCSFGAFWKGKTDRITSLRNVLRGTSSISQARALVRLPILDLEQEK